MTGTSTTVLVAAALVVMAEVTVQRSEPAFEASAIAALRAITSGQLAYADSNGGYAGSLKVLAAPCAMSRQGFISPNLATDPTVRNGYEIELRSAPAGGIGPRDCNGVPTSAGYYATATPLTRAGTALRAFAVDQNGVIWSDTRGAPPVPPFTPSSSVMPVR